MGQSDKKAVLITGASRGLGKRIALTLAGNNYSVVVNYLSAEKEAAAVTEKINGDSLAIKADVRDSRQVRTMAEKIRATFGRLDAVIHNAGITKDRLLLKQTEGEWEEIMNTNLTGCFHVIKYLSPLLIDTDGGHIITVSSYSGVKGKTGQAAYSASKAGLLGLTFSAARELAAHDIRVNAILPGYMETDMGAAAPDAMQAAKEESIMRTLSDTGTVAEFIVYLLKTDHITGQVFSLDSRIL